MDKRLKIKALTLPLLIFLPFLLTGCAGNTFLPKFSHHPDALHHHHHKSTAEHIVWQWPAEGKIIRTFGSNNEKNKGIDIAGKREANVYATAFGKVVYCGPSLYSYGELIIVKHKDNFVSVYSHVKNPRIKEKAFVKASQKIAKIAQNKKGESILHFEIRQRGVPVNPLLFIETKT